MESFLEKSSPELCATDDEMSVCAVILGEMLTERPPRARRWARKVRSSVAGRGNRCPEVQRPEGTA